MDMDTVGDLARHAQHPRIHRGDVDFGIGRLDGSRVPLRSDEIEVVEVPMVVECAGTEGGETGLDGEHVVAQTRAGAIEGHAVPPHDMRANLRAEAEPELPVGRLLE